MKPLALDLCCGKGGWTIGLLAAGWDVIGVDVEEWEGYPARQFTMDVRHFTKEVLDMSDIPAGRKVSLVVASPPCQEFSYSSFPFKKAREKFTSDNPPDPSIWRACKRIAKELNAPLILENVRGARKWMGRETFHYGSFCFWGELPALLPIGNPRKGFHRARPTSGLEHTGGFVCAGTGNASRIKKTEPGKETAFGGNSYHTQKFGWNDPKVQDQRKRSGMGGEPGTSKGKIRKEWSAKAAMIPYELAHWIGTCFYPKLKP